MHINERQQAIVNNQQDIAVTLGKWNKGIGGDGAHYILDNGFARDGIRCGNCVFYLSSERRCAIVEGEILPQAVCKLWVIPEGKLNPVFVALRALEGLGGG